MIEEKVTLKTGTIDKIIYESYNNEINISENITVLKHIKPYVGVHIDELLNDFITNHQNYGLICTTSDIIGDTPPKHNIERYCNEISDIMHNSNFLHLYFTNNEDVYIYENENCYKFISDNYEIIQKYYI